MSDSLSMAFLVLLESLSPTERAVFLLHEVFGYGYTEIAEITGKCEPKSRQIFVRARHHVDEGEPRFDASREQRDEVARRFFDAGRRRGPGRTNEPARPQRRHGRRRRRQGPGPA